MTTEAAPAPRASGRLAGKSSVITGAALGIGRARAQVFAAEGARLVLTDIQPGPLEATAAGLREQAPRW